METRLVPTQTREAVLRQSVLRARGGDRQAFGELHRSCYREVLRPCRRLLRRPEDAEDAAAEVFLKLAGALASYNPSQPFSPWLRSVTQHHCVDRLRQQKVERRIFVGDEKVAPVPAEPSTSPLSLLLAREQRSRVREQLRQLPARYRLPLVMRYYRDMSYDEIAQALGRNPNTVKTLLFRAKKELRQRIAEGLPPA